MTVEGVNPSPNSFGGRIRELRRGRGLTQRQAAAEIGVDFTYLSKLENDRGDPPSEETIRRLALLYDVDAEELLALAGKLPPELRQRALTDPRFATFLRRLPTLPDDRLLEMYREAEPSEGD